MDSGRDDCRNDKNNSDKGRMKNTLWVAMKMQY